MSPGDYFVEALAVVINRGLVLSARPSEHDASPWLLLGIGQPRSSPDGYEASSALGGVSENGILERLQKDPQHTAEIGFGRQDPQDSIPGKNEFHVEFARGGDPGLSECGVNHPRDPRLLRVGWAGDKEVNECRRFVGQRRP